MNNQTELYLDPEQTPAQLNSKQIYPFRVINQAGKVQYKLSAETLGLQQLEEESSKDFRKRLKKIHAQEAGKSRVDSIEIVLNQNKLEYGGKVYDAVVTGDYGQNAWHICLGDHNIDHYAKTLDVQKLRDQYGIPIYGKTEEDGKDKKSETNPFYIEDYSISDHANIGKTIRKYLPHAQYPNILFLIEKTHFMPKDACNGTSKSQPLQLSEIEELRITMELLGIDIYTCSAKRNKQALHFYFDIVPGEKNTPDCYDTIAKHQEILGLSNNKGETPIPFNYVLSRLKSDTFNYLFNKDVTHSAFCGEKKRVDNILGQMRSNELYKTFGGHSINKRDGKKNVIHIDNEINPYYNILEILLPKIGEFMDLKIPYYDNAILEERWSKYDLSEMQNAGSQNFITISQVFGFENYLPNASEVARTKTGTVSFAKNSGNPYKQDTPEECMLGYKTNPQHLREDSLERMLVTLSPFIVICLKSMEENVLEGYEASELRLHTMPEVGKIKGGEIVSKTKFFEYIIPNKDDTPNGGVARAKIWFDLWKGGRQSGNATMDRFFRLFWPSLVTIEKSGNKDKRIPLAKFKKNKQSGPKLAISKSMFRQALYQAFYFFAKNIPQYIKTSPPKNLYTDENPDYSNVIDKYMPYK